jgi:biotin carboxyl carrier protein
MSKQNYVVNGKSYEVEVGEIAGSTVEVVVDGAAYTVEVPQAISKPKPAAVAVKAASPSKPVSAPASAAASGGPAVLASGSANEIVAPMPGTILDVLVKPGDTVTKGQEVISLEAMKMRNAIRSTKDGVVSNVLVNAGQKVKHNQVLVQID